MHTYSDDRGHSLMSVFDHVDELPGQFNISVMYAGAVKAWHRHAHQNDHWVVVTGDLKVGLFNTENSPIEAEVRLAGPAAGADTVSTLKVPPSGGLAVFLGEHRPGVLRIPKGLWHGATSVGGRDAILLYYVTQKYDPRHPDEERRPWDAFPFAWEVESR